MRKPKFSKAQIEAAAKVIADAEGEWAFYEYPINDFNRDEYRAKALRVLEAATNAEED